MRGVRLLLLEDDPRGAGDSGDDNDTDKHYQDHVGGAQGRGQAPRGPPRPDDALDNTADHDPPFDAAADHDPSFDAAADHDPPFDAAADALNTTTDHALDTAADDYPPFDNAADDDAPFDTAADEQRVEQVHPARL